MKTNLSDEDKKEYMNLMHEYADLMDEVDAFLADDKEVVANASVAANDYSASGIDSTVLVNPDHLPTSDADRLAALRSKLNI